MQHVFKRNEHFHQKSSTGQNDAYVKPRHRVAYHWLGIAKIRKNTKFEQNIPCGTRVISIFNRAYPENTNMKPLYLGI